MRSTRRREESLGAKAQSSGALPLLEDADVVADGVLAAEDHHSLRTEIHLVGWIGTTRWCRFQIRANLRMAKLCCVTHSIMLGDHVSRDRAIGPGSMR